MVELRILPRSQAPAQRGQTGSARRRGKDAKRKATAAVHLSHNTRYTAI